MDSKMTAMGMKRSAMAETGPKEVDKNWENEVVYPSVHVSGKQAEMMGAESLEDGECVEQTVVWRVKKTTIETDGKKRYELTLDLVRASDPKSAEDCGDTPTDDSDEENSPGLDYILKQ